MKLSHWAKEKGILYRTAWLMFNRGQLTGAYKLPTGTIIIPNEINKIKEEYIITDARVSSS